MADVREKVEQIRQAIYGIEVRESIASGIEAINTEVESTTQRQTTLETDMAEAKREAEEAAVRADTAAGDAEDITEAMAVWEEYDPEKDYVPLNKTTYQGGSYINVLACKGVPPTEETHWLPIASKGDQGVPGPTPTLVVGDTTTLSPDSAATVTRRAGSPDDAPVLDFGIPRGVDGTGSGDMSKAIYDDNDDGKVNAADIADRVPDGAITDDMLSDDPSHIKARLSSHMAEYASVFKLKSIISRRGALIQSIPNDTYTAILFNVARRTDDSLITYDATTGEFTIVSPDIKLIRVTVLVTWVPNANGYRLVGIDYNGNIYNPESPGIQILPASVGGAFDSKEPLQQMSALILPTVGYKFTATVRHNAGTAINLSNRNFISMEVYV